QPVGRGIRAEARYSPRLVVIVPVQAVPTLLRETCLPAPERRLEVQQPERLDVPLAAWPLVQLDVLELEHHVHLASGGVREQQRVVHRRAGRLTHRQQSTAVAGDDLAVQLVQELVNSWTADEVP